MLVVMVLGQLSQVAMIEHQLLNDGPRVYPPTHTVGGEGGQREIGESEIEGRKERGERE